MCLPCQVLTWPPVGSLKLLPCAQSLDECIILFKRCVVARTSMMLGVLSRGASNTCLRLIADGVCDGEGSCETGGGVVGFA